MTHRGGLFRCRRCERRRTLSPHGASKSCGEDWPRALVLGSPLGAGKVAGARSRARAMGSERALPMLPGRRPWARGERGRVRRERTRVGSATDPAAAALTGTDRAAAGERTYRRDRLRPLLRSGRVTGAGEVSANPEVNGHAHR
jgi:hypothetical protein